MLRNKRAFPTKELCRWNACANVLVPALNPCDAMLLYVRAHSAPRPDEKLKVHPHQPAERRGLWNRIVVDRVTRCLSHGIRRQFWIWQVTSYIPQATLEAVVVRNVRYFCSNIGRRNFQNDCIYDFRGFSRLVKAQLRTASYFRLLAAKQRGNVYG